MSERRKLETAIEDWCKQHPDAHVVPHTEDDPERYEIRWFTSDDPSLVRFINIYPRKDYVIIQKGIADKNDEQGRHTIGSLFNRKVDQVYRTLDELKPYTDALSRDYLDGEVAIGPTAQASMLYVRQG